MSAVALGLVVALVLLVAQTRRPGIRPREIGRGRRSVVLDVGSTRRFAVVAAGAFGFLVRGPVLGVAAASIGVCSAPILGAHRRRRVQAARANAVPDLVDLFLVSASAGQPVAASLVVVSSRAPAVVRSTVAAARDRFDRGLPLADCISEMGDALGPRGQPLADALRQAASDGVPLVPLLEGVAATARDERRRRAQEAARRLPVTMLFPLAMCILPAAVLLAVVPVLLVSVASLGP